MLRSYPGEKAWLLTVYGLLIVSGIALAYFELRDIFPPLVEVVLPIAYLALVLVVVKHGFPASDSGVRKPIFEIRLHIPNLAKSLICMVASILWAGLAASLTTDTSVGNAIAAVPALAILGVGAFYFAKSFSNRIR
jgi:hypothetical protein